MSVPLAMEGLDTLALAQEGERLCRENNLRAGVKYLRMALDKGSDLETNNPEMLSAIYSQLGNAYFALRNFDEALKYHQLDLDAATKLNDQSGVAKANGNIGNTFKAIGDFDLAYDYAVNHLRIAREMNDKECEARALYNLAAIHHCQAKNTIRSVPRPNDSTVASTPSNINATSQLQSAITCYGENLKIVEAMKDVAACGRTYGNLGNTYYMMGEYSTAVYFHKKRLGIARQFGDRAAMRRAYTNLANANIFLKDYGAALEYYRLALALAVELHDEVTEAQCCFNVGNGAAISGDHNTALEYLTRVLTLSRKLGDSVGEARACMTLGSEYATLGDVRKAVYFFVLQAVIAQKQGDRDCELNARNSLMEALGGEEKFEALELEGARASDVSFDVDGDPEPRPVEMLTESLRALLSTDNDCSLSRRTATTSTSNLCDEQPQVAMESMDEEAFFDRLTRMQSKRLNDQRCDPTILSDLTNRSKGVSRQSDTLVRNLGGNDGNHGGPSASEYTVHRRAKRLPSLFGRVGRSVARLSMGHSFAPMSTSTPRLRPSTLSASSTLSSKTFEGGTTTSGTTNMLSVSSMSEIRMPNFDRTFASGASDEILEGRGEVLPSLREVPSGVDASASPVFRIPVAPPRHKQKAQRTMSLTSLNSLRMKSQKGDEGMYELIVSVQGRRMDEQRAQLNVGSAETVSVSDGAAQPSGTPEDRSEEEHRERVERSRSEDAGSLYEMVLRSQGDRLDEQRSELPGSQPDEEISQIVITMQKGRIDAQRAHLNPPGED